LVSNFFESHIFQFNLNMRYAFWCGTKQMRNIKNLSFGEEFKNIKRRLVKAD